LNWREYALKNASAVWFSVWKRTVAKAMRKRPVEASQAIRNAEGWWGSF
jgi:hypothetical protein